MPGYFAKPDGVSYAPVVLVAMEIFGLHEYIKDVTRRLAKLGAIWRDRACDALSTGHVLTFARIPRAPTRTLCPN